MSGQPDAAFHAALLGLCSIVLLLAALMSVRDRREVLLPGFRSALPELCSTKRIWGLDCPGCGMTRSFIALAHGDLTTAWSYNPAATWLFAIMAFQVPYRIVQLVRLQRGQQELSLGYLTQAALLVLVVGLVGQWLWRIVEVAF